jgi:hypothetical protein
MYAGRSRCERRIEAFMPVGWLAHISCGIPASALASGLLCWQLLFLALQLIGSVDAGPAAVLLPLHAGKAEGRTTCLVAAAAVIGS